MDRLYGQNPRESHALLAGGHLSLRKYKTGPARCLLRPSMRFRANTRWNCGDALWQASEFFKSLSPLAMREIEAHAKLLRCDSGTVLLSEGEQPGRVLFLLEGRVKISINSAKGRRLILSIAEPGDILGLSAAVSGFPSEFTAEAQYPCRLAWLSRPGFVEFLLRHPIAFHSVTRLMSQDYRRVCEHLRMMGHTQTATEKLAQLLLEWCTVGRKAGEGIYVQCLLTHEEIGECIGVSRETVSRTLTEFKHRDLVQQDGSTLLVPSLHALEAYACRADD